MIKVLNINRDNDNCSLVITDKVFENEAELESYRETLQKKYNTKIYFITKHY